MDEACLVSQHVLWTHPKVMRHYCFTRICITAILSTFILRWNKYFLHDTGFISASDTGSVENSVSPDGTVSIDVFANTSPDAFNEIP